MGYPPRLLEPDAIHFITSRTIEGVLYLRPSPKINNVIGASLARAQRRRRVEIFDYTFLSNHFHLAARAPLSNLPAFMRDLKSGIAIGVNRILERRGHVWERRYMPSPILDEEAQLERALYIYGHGVKEGLVERPELWPGVASIKERLTGVREVYDLVDHTALSRARYRRKAPQDPAEFTTKVTVELSPWPCHADLAPREARRLYVDLANQATEKAAESRGGKPALGVERVLAQDPRERPRSTKRSPKPLCHASSKDQRQAYRMRYAKFVDEYMSASELFRSGDVDVEFPLHSYRPPLPLEWSPTASRSRPPPM